MFTKHSLIASLTLILTLALAACAPSTPENINIGAPDVTPTPQEEAPTEEAEEKAAPGEMNYATLVEALSTAGATVEPRDPVEQPFFSVEGQVINVDGQDVQVFEYADAAARQAESDTISEDGTQVGTTMAMWIDTPHFYVNGDLIVLYIGSDQATLDLLSGVLGDPVGQ